MGRRAQRQKNKIKKMKIHSSDSELKQASAAERRAVNLERAQRMSEEKNVSMYIYKSIFIHTYIHTHTHTHTHTHREKDLVKTA